MLIMGDVDRWFLLLENQTSQFRPNVFSKLSIEIAHRFIEKINLWIANQGPCQSNTLALTSRQLSRTMGRSIRELHEIENSLDLDRSISGLDVADLQPQFKVFKNG